MIKWVFRPGLLRSIWKPFVDVGAGETLFSFFGKNKALSIPLLERGAALLLEAVGFQGIPINLHNRAQLDERH